MKFLRKLLDYAELSIYIFFNYLKFYTFYRLFSFKEILNYVKKSSKTRKTSRATLQNIKKINGYISSLLRIKSCMIISIVLFKTLKRKGYKPSLMIGVQKDKKEFKSHAWVKLSEKEFFLSPDEEYKRIMEIT